MKKSIYLISYFLDDEEKAYKIGYTKREVGTRVKELKTANPNDLIIEKVYETDQYTSNIERMLHKEFKHKKIDGEWFLLDDEDVSKFESLCDKFYQTFDMLQNQNTYIIDNNITYK